MPRLKSLDELGIRRGTDKCSLEHDYLSKYERLFTPFRDAPITILEIGIRDGASLQLWEDFFPRARVVGVDIEPDCKQLEGGRRVVEIASQADPEAMAAIGRKYQPAIVIDDGSHMADHIMISFEALYPLLSEGGLYIIEDLGMHAGPGAAMARGSAPDSPQAYFLRLANCVAVPHEEVDFDRQIATTTEAVEFIYCATVIRKGWLPEPDEVTRRRSVVQSANSAQSWLWFSRYLRRLPGFENEAIESARRSVEMNPQDWYSVLQLSYALAHGGQLGEAMAAALDAARQAPGHPFIFDIATEIATKIEAQERV